MSSTKARSYSLTDFTWDAVMRTLSAEASDIAYCWESYLKISSPTTGGGRVFELVKQVTDKEGEVLLWKFECRADPTLKLNIFND